MLVSWNSENLEILLGRESTELTPWFIELIVEFQIMEGIC